MPSSSKMLYKPLALAASVGGGLLASAVFSQIWKRVDNSQEPPPDPKDLEKSTTSVLAAAALQGLVFAVVRAAVDRASARGFKAVTHQSPQ
ncbi:hypothetical protein BVC93_19945 [Mycobacterium sp. MS1601]|uniref:DUF4235 domain-containing protein n=1 Tax=Mycobacterium sp. MS1601 TaxID=1936029 RepID=UPI0009796274|nr:DUF4235 domain-containing protein [Mycobacterium sp. MS1601]AQA04317.1 hypothetical protein BVC93_19945 [Mycobacterium sp. MS1601]